MSLLLGKIHHAKGDAEQARDDVNAALSVFESIGAVPDANHANAVLAEIGGQQPTVLGV